MVFAPLGLWSVAAAAENAGHEVDFLDLNGGEEIPFGYDAYLVTGTTPQLRSMLEVPKRIGKGPLLIAGGPHASLRPVDLMQGGFHYVVRGEGEGMIGNLLERKAPYGVYSCARLDPSEIPHPIRRWAGQYHYVLEGQPATHAMLSRGCPWSCAFCCHALWGQKTVFMPAAWIVDELKAVKAGGYKGVMFYDDTFTIYRDRVAIIGNVLEKLGLVWRCFARSDSMTQDLAVMLATSGCVEVCLGVESGSDRILTNVGKRETVWQSTKAVGLLRDRGVRVKAFIIVGLPGETEETVEETKAWLRLTRPDDYDVTIFTPYPGTPIYEERAKYDIQWDGMEASQLWYKGIPGQYQSQVWTSGLSRQRIVELRDELEAMKAEVCRRPVAQEVTSARGRRRK